MSSAARSDRSTIAGLVLLAFLGCIGAKRGTLHNDASEPEGDTGGMSATGGTTSTGGMTGTGGATGGATGTGGTTSTGGATGTGGATSTGGTTGTGGAPGPTTCKLNSSMVGRCTLQ